MLRRIISASLLLCLFLSCEVAPEQKVAIQAGKSKKEVSATALKDGDVIFQTSLSSQSKAIELATHSEYSHCGIIFWEDGKCYVYEAIQPVQKTLLQTWINRGANKHYVVMRMIDTSSLTKAMLDKMHVNAQSYIGKNYDLYFGWSDEKIYCSELVWKVYHNAAGIDLAVPMKLKEFDLSNPLVKQKLKERYGNAIPLEEPAISPGQLYESKYLEQIISE